MQHEIYDRGQLNVKISNVRASDEEIERLKTAIASGIGSTNALPVVKFEGADRKGSRYTITFAVRGPRAFSLSTVQEWLYAVPLVGWDIAATAGPKE